MPVYVITDNPGKINVVKIGWSTNVEARITGLQISNHRPLRVLRVIEGSSATELWMHKRYKHLRMTGEWFRFDDEMFTIEPPFLEETSMKVKGRKPRKPITQDVWLGKQDAKCHNHHFDYGLMAWVLDENQAVT